MIAENHNNFLSLKGQRILIIGGSSRMGLAVAQASVALGAEVIISGRSAERLQAAVAQTGGTVKTYPADAAVAEEAAKLLGAFAPLDHIVVTASGEGSASSIPETAPQAAQGPFKRFWISYHALHFAPQNVRPSGSVTLLSGSSGRRPAVGYGVWSTLHGSIEALARAAALELAPIRVNVISPGGIGIPSDRQLAHHTGQPEDVAAMVLAVLINPAVTNTVIDVDGGERLGTWPAQS